VCLRKREREREMECLFDGERFSPAAAIGLHPIKLRKQTHT